MLDSRGSSKEWGGQEHLREKINIGVEGPPINTTEAEMEEENTQGHLRWAAGAHIHIGVEAEAILQGLTIEEGTKVRVGDSSIEGRHLDITTNIAEEEMIERGHHLDTTKDIMTDKDTSTKTEDNSK